MNKSLITFLLLFLSCQFSIGQQNGKLQIHFIDVGQGDAALLITPQGETVLFDDGVANYCNYPIDYLKKLGIDHIDYLIISHYHDDHIGCTEEVLQKFPLKVAAYDRGGSYNSKPFQRYIRAVGSKRKLAHPGQTISLDSCSTSPVVITVVAVNGAGISTNNENDLSLVSLVHFGEFDAVFGGDLSGYDKNGYRDIESIIAKKVEQVEVYKVHHHCSSYSTNDFWLAKIKPKVGIISASSTIGHNYHHPTTQCLKRLHKANVITYWTEQTGSATPDTAFDKIGGNIVIEVTPNSNYFTATYRNSITDTIPNWETAMRPHQKTLVPKINDNN